MKTVERKEEPKAVVYIRTASAEDDGSRQEVKITEYCKNEGIVIDAVFKDIGKSGLNLNRDGLKKLLIYMDKNKDKVHQIMVSGIDRISRIEADTNFIRWSLESMGIQIKDIAERTLGNSLLNQNASLSASDSFSKRIKEGIKQAKLHGKLIGKAPFGYVNKRDKDGKPAILIDEKKAEIIRFIFREYINGTPVLQISEKTRTMGFKHSGKSAIIKILNNTVYAGFIRLDGDLSPLLVKGSHEPIISEMEYLSVQAKLEQEFVKRKQQTRRKGL